MAIPKSKKHSLLISSLGFSDDVNTTEFSWNGSTITRR